MARQANCFAPLRESPFIIESISRKPYKHFFRPLRLDRWLEGLQQGNDKLDRFLVTARRVVCELGRGSSELRNLLARPVLGDGHGFGHRRHKDGDEVFRAFAAPLGVARDALPETMFNGWLRIPNVMAWRPGFRIRPW